MGIPDDYGFDCLAYPPTPAEISLAASSAVRAYEGPYENAWEFCQKMLGREVVVEGPPVTLAYLSPYPHPQAPWLYAARAGIEGFGSSYPDPDNPGEILFKRAVVTFNFQTFEYPVSETDSSAYTTIQLRSSNEFITTEGAYKFSSGQVVPGPVGTRVVSIDYVVQRQRVDSIKPAWFNLAGCVNNPEFDGKAIGTVLYNGAQADVQLNAIGGTRFSASFNLQWRSIPHNYLLNPYTGNFELATTIVGGNTIYEEADLNELLA